MVRTVASILENPRYTGRQVWNRQRTDHDSGSGSGRSWNDHSEWIVSDAPVHPPLVSEADFVAVQSMRAARPAADGSHRRYRLRGLVVCGRCGRRMDAHWINHRAGYRCRHGHTSARPRRPDLPQNLYTREGQLLELLAERLDLEDHDDFGPYLNDRGLVIVYEPDGVDIRPVNDVRPDQMVEPMSMG